MLFKFIFKLYVYIKVKFNKEIIKEIKYKMAIVLNISKSIVVSKYLTSILLAKGKVLLMKLNKI